MGDGEDEKSYIYITESRNEPHTLAVALQSVVWHPLDRPDSYPDDVSGRAFERISIQHVRLCRGYTVFTVP